MLAAQPRVFRDALHFAAIAVDHLARYLANGADFILVGADVALLARGSEALAAKYIPHADGDTPASY